MKLPIAKRAEYVKLKQQANEASKREKYFTCMVAIDDALSIFNSPAVIKAWNKSLVDAAYISEYEIMRLLEE